MFEASYVCSLPVKVCSNGAYRWYLQKARREGVILIPRELSAI